MTRTSKIHPVLHGKKSFTNLTYQRTRKFILYESMLTQCIYFMVSGSFLAGYLKYLGASDEISAVLMQLPLLSASAQLLSPIAYERLTHRMPLLRSTYLTYRGLLVTLGLVPLLFIDRSWRVAVFGILLFVAFGFSMFADVGYVEFLANIVPGRLRRRFLAKREMLQILSGTLLIFLMSKMLDLFKRNNAEGMGFYVFYFILFCLFLGNIYCFFQYREPMVCRKKSNLHLKDLIGLPLKNKKYRKFMLYFSLYYFSYSLSVSFHSIYMVGVLNLNYTYIATMILVCNLVRAFATNIWSRLPARFDAVNSLGLAVILLGVANFLWSTVTKSNCYIMLPIAHFVLGIAFAGIYTNMMQANMQFSPAENRTVYLSLNSFVGMIVGFLSASLGAIIAGGMKNVKLDLGFLSFEYIQIVFLISAAFCVLTGIYVLLVLGGEVKKSEILT